MPDLVPEGLIAPRALQVNGAAQLVVSGPVLYFGCRIVSDLGAGATTFTVADATAAGGPLIDICQTAFGTTNGTRVGGAPTRTESGIWTDGGGAANGRIIVYVAMLEYVTTESGLIPRSWFENTEA